MRLYDEEASIRAIVPNAETKSCATRDNDIVSLVIGQQAEVCLQHSLPVVDKVDLVTLCIAVVIVHSYGRLRDSQRDVLVEHQHLAAQYGVTTAGDAGSLEVMMTLYLFVPLFKLYAHEFLYFFQTPRWQRVVIVRLIDRQSFTA